MLIYILPSGLPSQELGALRGVLVPNAIPDGQHQPQSRPTIYSPVREAKVGTPVGGVDPLLLARRREAIQLGHLLLAEGNDLEVGLDTRGSDRLGEDDDTAADRPGDEDGGGGDTVLLGDSLEVGVGVERG